jgi:hypothetical protein
LIDSAVVTAVVAEISGKAAYDSASQKSLGHAQIVAFEALDVILVKEGH